MECGMVGWSASRLAGWLASWLLGSENRPTPIHSSSLSLFLPRAYITLCACIRTTRVWKMRGLDGGEERRNEGGFRKEEIFQRALPSDRRRGEDGTRNSPFFLPFLVTLWFAFFGRANVILIARLSALLCEFARHFFISFPREIADVGAEEGGKPRRVSGPSAPSPRVRVRTAGETKILPPLHLFPICSVLIPRCLVYRRRLFLAREGLFHYRCTQAGNGRQVHSSQRCILARFAARIYACILTLLV